MKPNRVVSHELSPAPAAGLPAAVSGPDLLVMGKDHVAYVRPVRLNNTVGFGLYSADGAQITVAATPAEAHLHAHQMALQAQTVH